MVKKAITLAALFATSVSSMAIAQDYDLVITGGRVIDPETLYDEIANVGITDGRIVTISNDNLKCGTRLESRR